MKKKILLTAVCTIIALSTSACANGVSKANYDAIVKERDSLKEKNEELEQIRKESTQKLLDLQQEQTNKELANVAPITWAETSFGKDGIYLVENPEYMLCIASGVYDTSQESIKDLWETTLLAAATLNAFSNEITYDKISVKYLAQDGTTLIEFSFKRQDGKYTTNGITGELSQALTLVSTLDNIR